jgi:hypothetical protein
MPKVVQRFKHSSKGFVAVMTSGQMRDDLQGRADKVKAAVEADLGPDSDREIIADTTVGKSRAGATIIGVSMEDEAKRRVLGRALDAAG